MAALDGARSWLEEAGGELGRAGDGPEAAQASALIGIGWALVAMAEREEHRECAIEEAHGPHVLSDGTECVGGPAR